MLKVVGPLPPVGLVNLNNTCYQNSTLQCLTRCRGFLEYLICVKHTSGSLGAELLNLAMSMAKSMKPVSPLAWKVCILDFEVCGV